MSFPVRLHRVFLGALVTFPGFLAVLPEKVLFDARKIPECPRWIVVDAGGFGADIDSLNDLSARSLLKLPWQVVTSSVELEVLVPLEPLLTNFTYKPVCGHQGLW